MPDYSVSVYQTISPREAKWGTKILIKRNGNKLIVTIPPGVHSGTKVRLTGAMLLTDNIYGDIFVIIQIRNSFGQVLVVLGILLALILAIEVIVNDKVPSKTRIEKVTSTVNSSENGEKNPSILVNGKVVTLIDNPDARDPTYFQLKQFLKRDLTDQNEYSENRYNCVDYAKDLHDHAESEGIKSAWVGVDFFGEEIGHALNAFNTIDHGLVFVDVVPAVLEERYELSIVAEANETWDKIAYIEIGKAYGVIDLDEIGGLTYDRFVVYKELCDKFLLQLENFYTEREKYDAALTNQNYSSGVLNQWAEDLDSQQESLFTLSENFDSCGYESLGIVEEIDITW